MLKQKLNYKRLSRILGDFKVYKKKPDNFRDFCSLVKVISGDKMVPFDLYSYQEKIYHAYTQHRQLHVTKVRQMGLSELMLFISMYRAIGNPTYTVSFFSHSDKATTALATRFRSILNSLVEYTTTFTDNIKTIQLNAGGKILFCGASLTGGVGVPSLHDLIIDEAGPIDVHANKNGGLKALIASAAPAQLKVGKNARTVLVSTPRGMAGHFYNRGVSNNPKEYQLLDICEKMRNLEIDPYQQWIDNNGCAKIVVHWMAHPTYSQNPNFVSDYAKENDLSIEEAEQEVNLSFTSSAEAVFHPFLVSSCCQGSFESEKDELSKYYIGVDTSAEGKDYFVAVVLKRDLRDDKYYFVDMYRKRKATKESHIVKISELIHKYSPHTVGIEITGNAGNLYLEDLKMRHLGTIFEEIKTTGKSKPFMIERLSHVMEKGMLVLPDKEMIRDEFLNFQRLGNKMMATPGKTDDIIMAVAFAITISPIYKKETIDLSSVSLV